MHPFHWSAENLHKNGHKRTQISRIATPSWTPIDGQNHRNIFSITISIKQFLFTYILIQENAEYNVENNNDLNVVWFHFFLIHISKIFSVHIRSFNQIFLHIHLTFVFFLFSFSFFFFLNHIIDRPSNYCENATIKMGFYFSSLSMLLKLLNCKCIIGKLFPVRNLNMVKKCQPFLIKLKVAV